MTDMRLDPGVTVTPGAVRVSDVTCVLSETNVRIWHIEMHSKYAELLGYDHDDAGFRIHLWAGEHGIKLDESYSREVPTTVSLPLPHLGFWEIVGDSHARYSLRIVAYHLPEQE